MHPVPDDPSALVPDPGTGRVRVTISGLACRTPGCDNDAAGLGTICTDCSEAQLAARTSSPSPRRLPDDRAPDLGVEELSKAVNQLLGAVPASRTGQFEHAWARLEDWTDRHQIRLPLSYGDDIAAYALHLLAARGLPVPSDGRLPDLPMEQRVVKATYQAEWSLIDKGHLRRGWSPPWQTYRRTPEGEQLWGRIRRRYLKANAGMAADALLLPDLFRLLVALHRPTDEQVRTAALVAAATHPGTVDETGHRVGWSFWEHVRAHDLDLLPDGGVAVTGNYWRRTRTVRIPAGTTARLLRQAAETRWGVPAADGTTVLAPDRWDGPLFLPHANNSRDTGWSKNGVKGSVACALTAVCDPRRLNDWAAGRGAWTMPTVGEGDVALDRLLRPEPERLRDGAYLANAFWVVARGGEILHRTAGEVTLHAPGPVWRLPRKPDKTGKRTQYAAPHLRWQPLDPTRWLERWLDWLARAWTAQGNDPAATRTTMPAFPTDLDDVANTAPSGVTRLNRRLAAYQDQYDFLPDDLHLTTHSLRHGFVTTGRLMGVPDPALMHAGGWTDVRTFHAYMSQALPHHRTTAAAVMRDLIDPAATPQQDPIVAQLRDIIAGLDPDCGCDVCATGAYPLATPTGVLP